MLEGKFMDDRIRKIYDTYKPFPSYIQVSLGVDADLRGEPGTLVRSCSTRRSRSIPRRRTTRSPSASSTSIRPSPRRARPRSSCFLATYNHEYWCGLREKDAARYEAEKERVAAAVTAVFESRFPEAQGKIEVVDVATPATIVRYTGTGRAAWRAGSTRRPRASGTLPCVLPGLAGFYMVGQWISPGGGLPSGLMTGRAVSKAICKDNKMPWRPA